MNRRTRKIALVLAVTIVASFGASAPARAADGMELALQDDAALVTQAYLGYGKAFPLMEQLKVRWIRVNVGWAAVVRSGTGSKANSKAANAKSKPSNLRYDFTSYDTLLNAARNKNMQLEVGLTTPAPRWATGDKRKAGPFKPNAKEFRSFVNAVVSHFGTNVIRYSVLNEPNHVGWLAPLKSQASLYRSLYTTAYKEIKKLQPTAQVLIGETAPYASRKDVAQPPLTFLRALTKSGSLKADGYAHHPYDLTGHAPNYNFPGRDNVTIGTLGRLTKMLDSLAASGRLETPSGDPLDLYLTEFGYLRSGKKKVSESNRAKYIDQAYDIALANPRVRQMLHFLLAQPTKKYLFFDTSLTSRSGGKTSTFKALASWATDNAARVNTR